MDNKKLISVDSLLSECENSTWDIDVAELQVILKYVPVVDAVEVVRCKKCRFNSAEKKCLHPDSIIKVPADNDYCSYGEPRQQL